MVKYIKRTLGSFSDMKYGKIPNKNMVRRNGKYPVFSGYRIVGYCDEYNLEGQQLVVVARGVGGTGDVKLSPGTCYLTNLSIAVLIDERIALKEYIYYYFRKNKLRYLDSGSAQSQITISDLRSVEVVLPPLEVQSQIVFILDLIDRKIANNNAINENLQQQAQMVFRREILYADARDEWVVGNLLDIADYLNGLAMQRFRPTDNEVGLPVLKIKELRQGYCDKNGELCSPSIKTEYIVHDGDVIFSWSGSLMIDFWCGGICGLNQHLFKVTSKKYPKWFYYVWSVHHLGRFITIAADKATTMGHIKREDLQKAEVYIPDDDTMTRVGGLLQPIYDCIINNRIENRKLAELRDTLLSKLILSEIDTSKTVF